jgi:hypothetical protein
MWGWCPGVTPVSAVLPNGTIVFLNSDETYGGTLPSPHPSPQNGPQSRVLSEDTTPEGHQIIYAAVTSNHPSRIDPVRESPVHHEDKRRGDHSPQRKSREGPREKGELSKSEKQGESHKKAGRVHTDAAHTSTTVMYCVVVSEDGTVLGIVDETAKKVNPPCEPLQEVGWRGLDWSCESRVV